MSTDWCLEAEHGQPEASELWQGLDTAAPNCKQREGAGSGLHEHTHVLTGEGTSACELHLRITNWDRAQETDTGERQKFDGNSTKTKGFVPKLCTGNHHRVGKLFPKNHRSIRAQTPENPCENSKNPQKQNRGAQVKDLLGDHPSLITHVLAPKSLEKFHPNHSQIRRKKNH